MNTDITDNAAYKGVVLYDAHCRVCAGLAMRCEALLAAHGFAMAPLQTHGRPARRQPNAEERFDEMVLLTADGRCFGGAEALVVLARGYWWALPLSWLARLPGVLPLLRFGYAWVARHRHCAGGACRIDRPYLTNGWLKLGYQATNLAFALLPLIYALAAWKGATP